MKAGWRLVPLEGVASFFNGLWTGKKGPFTTAKVIRNTNFRPHGVLSFDDIAEIEVEERQLEKRQLQFGDIVIEKSGGGPKQAVGRVVAFELADDGYSFSNFTSAIRVNDPSQLHYRFLLHALNWWYVSGVTEKIQSNSTGIRNLDFGAYKALPIPLPPLDEQKRIVAFLDEAFEGLSRARANTEANLADARELFNQMRSSFFSQPSPTWATHMLSEVCEKITDGTHQTPKYFESGHVFLSSRNVTSGRIDWENVKFIDDSQHVEMQRRVSPRRGDVLLAKNGTTGVGAIVDRDISFDIYVSLALLRAKAGLLPELLLHFINSAAAKQQFNGRLKGSGVPNLHLKEIREVTISYPKDENEQRDIVARIEEVLEAKTEMEAALQTKLRLIDTLRQSLLQKAFSGELT
ncbi:MAG: restriction endonuclease subunit S [Gemmobacter sp.]|uniref:restriction endonuclease subunit S n=1 Tax=Gemmobacter sp. TaxID=1898957 RepID=UPI001A5BFCBA|nr:restriction endonuclease subunit S [Gemmobacter sp.]MBL8563872.1 restriction endonuclease subunit S [Gemmobacter sp.]